MKFSINAKAFATAMQSVAKITDRRNTIPVLGNILIEAGDGALTLKATDLDAEISLTVPAQVTVKGSTTVPASTSSEMLRKMDGGAEVTFSSDETKALIVAGRARASLFTLPASDFPELNAGRFQADFTVGGSEFVTAIEKVRFAVSTEETRYYLNGIYMHPSEDGTKVILVATDGHRLSKTSLNVGAATNMPNVIVPRKTVGLIVDLCRSAKAVTVSVSDTKIRFAAGDTVLTSKLIDGTFPDYKRVIPPLSNMTAIVDAKPLAVAADRVSTVSNERSRAVKLTFTSGKLALAVNSADNGAASEEIDADYQNDDAFEIGFNSKYLAEALAQIGGGKARINLVDSGSPTIFSSEDEGDADSLVVLMPMRV